VHIEIPLDVMSEIIDVPELHKRSAPQIAVPPNDVLEEAAAMCSATKAPVLLVGGGAKAADIQSLAERLDAPVVTTVNARGVMSGHDLLVPASPSFPSVRALLAQADLVVAAGTQFGPTDFDMYLDGGFPALKKLIRIDVDLAQAHKGQKPDLAIIGDAASYHRASA
jgi:acetolactate synthase-1/2/3 large subunit